MKQPSVHKTPYHHRSIVMAFVRWAFHFILLSLVAWALLIIWFATLAVRQNMDVSLYNMQENINAERAHLAKHFSLADQVLDKTFSSVQRSFAVVRSYLNQLLAKFDYKNSAEKISFYQSKSINAVLIVYQALRIVVTRLAVFILAMPFLLSLLFVFVIDGLGQRDVRKFQCAKESTFSFHAMQPLVGALFLLSFLVYLACPVYISPGTFLVPIGMIMGVLLMLSLRNFKKYV